MRRIAGILTMILVSFLMVSSDPHQSGSRRPGFGCVREWAIWTDSCVLAVPTDPSFPPLHFKVVRVLRGAGIKPGDSIKLVDDSNCRVEIFDEDVPYREKPRRVEKEEVGRVEKALLFLGTNRGTREKPSFLLKESRICFGLQYRRVLIPRGSDCQYYVLESESYVNWGDLVDQTRLQSAEVNDLYERKKIRQIDRRNRALLEWIERHRDEFGTGMSFNLKDRAHGWGCLETWIFDWVLNSDEPAGSWSAIRLYAELNRGEIPFQLGPSFASPEGRSLLLRIATASNVLEGHRIRALKVLSYPQTLWTYPSKEHPRAKPLQAEEQTDLLDRIQPLLTARTSTLREAAALALRCASYPEDDKQKKMWTKQVLLALIKAYRIETPGDARNELAIAVCLIGGSKHWHELTGNPPGMLVCLNGLEQDERFLSFRLDVCPSEQEAYESPKIVMERLGKEGKVVETKQCPMMPNDKSLKFWSERQSRERFSVLRVNYRPGTWRLTIHGAVGCNGSA